MKKQSKENVNNQECSICWAVSQTHQNKRTKWSVQNSTKRQHTHWWPDQNAKPTIYTKTNIQNQQPKPGMQNWTYKICVIYWKSNRKHRHTRSTTRNHKQTTKRAKSIIQNWNLAKKSKHTKPNRLENTKQNTQNHSESSVQCQVQTQRHRWKTIKQANTP